MSIEDGFDLHGYVENLIDEEAAVDSAADYIRRDPGHLLEWFALENDVEHVGSYEDWNPADDPLLGAAYEAFRRRMAREGLDEFMRAVETGMEIDGGRVVVWRAITVPEIWTTEDLASRPLGLCWAFDPDHAEAHWGGGGMTVVIEGTVDPVDVDWQVSANLAAEALHTYGQESELRMLPTAEVVVRAVWTKRDRRSLFLDGPVACSAWRDPSIETLTPMGM